MTADELIERLKELDGGLHLQVIIHDQQADEDEYQNSLDFSVRRGYFTPSLVTLDDGGIPIEPVPVPRSVIFIEIEEWYD